MCLVYGVHLSVRKKRYKKQTLEALKAIVEDANNKSTMEIEGHLSSLFDRSIEVEEQTAVTTAAQQQQSIVKA